MQLVDFGIMKIAPTRKQTVPELSVLGGRARRGHELHGALQELELVRETRSAADDLHHGAVEAMSTESMGTHGIVEGQRNDGLKMVSSGSHKKKETAAKRPLVGIYADGKWHWP
jgi:hypothetical protein